MKVTHSHGYTRRAGAPVVEQRRGDTVTDIFCPEKPFYRKGVGHPGDGVYRCYWCPTMSGWSVAFALQFEGQTYIIRGPNARGRGDDRATAFENAVNFLRKREDFLKIPAGVRVHVIKAYLTYLRKWAVKWSQNRDRPQKIPEPVMKVRAQVVNVVQLNGRP